MFYPFNAHVASDETKKARTIRKDEDAILVDSYLSIAHVYIQRAVSRGNKQTMYIARMLCVVSSQRHCV